MADAMKWKKAPDELVDFINNKLAGKNCDYRLMFGFPAYFVNGNMFAGLFEDKLFLRLSDSDIEVIKKNFDIIPFEPIPGRRMKNYMILPKELYTNDNEFNKLIDKSMQYTSLLPNKKTKKKS
jgi:TfoX/Sxy family transcriptional regulator of competence genes